MHNIKKITVLNTLAEVNEHLKQGWCLIKIIDSGTYVLGMPKEIYDYLQDRPSTK